MTNSYNMGQMGYPQNYYYNQNFNNQPSIFSTVTGSALLGFAGGSAVSAGIDLVRNRRPVKNGEVSDYFATKVMDKIVDKGYAAKGKDYFKQKYYLLKKLGKIKSTDEFIELLNKNRKYASSLFDGISLDTVCKTVTKDNLKGKITSLKSRIEASIEPEIRNVKDTISLCWDNEAKKFVKPKNVEEKIFKVIKNTKNNIQWKKMLKYGGITAGVFGAVTLVYSMLMDKGRVNIQT